MPDQFPGRLHATLLALGTVLLFALGFLLFTEGQPGAPRLPAQSFGTKIVLYLPAEAVRPDSPVREIRSIYRADLADPAVTLQEVMIDYGLDQERTPAILEFEGSARMDAIRSPDAYGNQDVVVAKELPNSQLLMRDLADLRIVGRMRVPAIATENSRTSFASPSIGEVMECPDLTDGPTVAQATASQAAWNEFRFSCTFASGETKASVEIVEPERQAVRVDYTEPKPDDNASLRWTKPQSDTDVVARASYANINDEAAVQRAFFLAGTVIGLAGGALPSAIQLLYQSLARPHRRRPVPAGTDPSGVEAVDTHADEAAMHPGTVSTVRNQVRDHRTDPVRRRRRPRC